MNLTARALLAAGIVFASGALAADFDGNAPLTCTAVSGHDCLPGQAQCATLVPQTPGPKELRIDFAGKTVKTPYRTDKLPIQNSSSDDEQLVMQGTDLKFAWSAIVNRKSGALTLAVADRKGSYVIFGKCKPAAAK
jgi:hypothetical protein